MTTITLRWEGPYAFWPQDGLQWFHDVESLSQPGIYLWTVPFHGGDLIDYVGEANEVKGRLLEHLNWFMTGRYVYYDLEKLKSGQKDTVYFPNQWSDFMKNFENHSHALRGQLELIRVYFACPSSDKSLLRQIESRIIQSLRDAEGDVANFLSNQRLTTSDFDGIDLIHDTSHAGNTNFHGLQSAPH